MAKDLRRRNIAICRRRVAGLGEPFSMFYKTAKMTAGGGQQGRATASVRQQGGAECCFGTGCHIRRGVAELAKQVSTAVTLSASLGEAFWCFAKTAYGYVWRHAAKEP